MRFSSKVPKKLRFKESNFKTFSFFLVFTTLLWLLMKFSKNYTHEITATVHYINIPEDRLLNAKSDSILSFVLTGNGFKLMNYRLFKPELNIDVERSIGINSKKHYFLTQQHKEFLKKQLAYDGEIKAISADTLYLHFDSNRRKKIPVHMDASITYASSFASERGLIAVPDSVVVSGPKYLVDTTRAVVSKRITLENINTDQEITIDFELDHFPENLQIIPNQIKGIVDVEKFTEGTLVIPIQLMNTPKDKQVKIFPKNVTLVYRVSLAAYDHIKINDFKAIADYAKRGEANAFIPIQITKKPEQIQNMKLQEKQVQFVIVK